MTRRQQVFNYLHERLGQWVDGPDLANETVGGSEGLRRLREQKVELASRGFAIEAQRNPSPFRTSWQYRLVAIEPVPVDNHTVEVPDSAGKYVCPKPTCAQTLRNVVASEFDERYGFGSCLRHGAQMVKL